MKTKITGILLAVALLIVFSGCDRSSTSSAASSTTFLHSPISGIVSDILGQQEDTSPSTASAADGNPTLPKGGNASGNGNSPLLPKQDGSASSGGNHNANNGGAQASGGNQPPKGNAGDGTQTQAPSPTPAPTPSSPSRPENLSKPTEPSIPPIPNDLIPYVYPFNISAIKSDLIRYGESLGMTHRLTHPDGAPRTPQNCSWWDPYTLSKNTGNPESVRRKLREMIAFDKDQHNLTDFTIFMESGPDGKYNVYMLR